MRFDERALCLSFRRGRVPTKKHIFNPNLQFLYIIIASRRTAVNNRRRPMSAGEKKSAIDLVNFYCSFESKRTPSLVIRVISKMV